MSAEGHRMQWTDNRGHRHYTTCYCTIGHDHTEFQKESEQ